MGVFIQHTCTFKFFWRIKARQLQKSKTPGFYSTQTIFSTPRGVHQATVR